MTVLIKAYDYLLPRLDVDTREEGEPIGWQIFEFDNYIKVKAVFIGDKLINDDEYEDFEETKMFNMEHMKQACSWLDFVLQKCEPYEIRWRNIIEDELRKK